ncbi:RluA family pseudouridine synthase [Telmatospirillum sp. J64-1]|uniref:RluA family pseudouridine synthase n=1 Tax=Telmatospirillum sp. J64-1 TaxID=2502183 RepID=UPI00115D0636|nr:RNA pseudouridine synthase [Telmatospirillum sp. J64-1]
MSPDELRARILHKDSNLLILDKPAGLAVHAGPRTPVHLEAMLGALDFGLRQPPALVHRLDRDTAGCLVLARHHKAVRRLGRLFAAGAVEKTYWAVVEGRPPEEEGRIDLSLRKVTGREGWRMVTDPAGQAAVTDYVLRGTGDGLSWLELHPRTGRTHQIRIHCAALGMPLLGDPVYGRAGPMMHLLSRKVAVPYWEDRPPVTAIAPPPVHMEAALRQCGWE